MTNQTSEAVVLQAMDLLQEVLQQINELRQQLEVTTRTARVGGEEAAGDAKGQLVRLRVLLETCIKMESQFADFKRAHSPAAADGSGALDLEQARLEIGCRLDRLRTAGCPRRLP